MHAWTLLIALAACLGAAALAPAGERAARTASPLLVAHRGLARHAPENTLANFTACLGLGFGFEMDLRRTRDGHLVCLHDATVDRTTSGTGALAELTLEELQRLDAGSRFDPAFAGQRVPTLEQVFALVRDLGRPDTLVAMDFKGEDPQIEADMVAAAKRYGVLDRVLAIGRPIELRELRLRLRQADPGTHTAVLVKSPEALPEALAATDADWVYVRFIPTEEQASAIHRAGRRIFIAGPLVVAAQPGNWRLARERGVDAILTDEPLEVRQLWRSPPEDGVR